MFFSEITGRTYKKMMYLRRGEKNFGKPRKPYTKNPEKWTETGGRIDNEAHAKRMQDVFGGKPKSTSQKKKMSNAKKDVPKSPEHVASMRLSQQRRRAAERNEPWQSNGTSTMGKTFPNHDTNTFQNGETK